MNQTLAPELLTGFMISLAQAFGEVGAMIAVTVFSVAAAAPAMALAVTVLLPAAILVISSLD